eukprot:1631413-Rhodomonas_salina.2
MTFASCSPLRVSLSSWTVGVFLAVSVDKPFAKKASRICFVVARSLTRVLHQAAILWAAAIKATPPSCAPSYQRALFTPPGLSSGGCDGEAPRLLCRARFLPLALKVGLGLRSPGPGSPDPGSPLLPRVSISFLILSPGTSLGESSSGLGQRVGGMGVRVWWGGGRACGIRLRLGAGCTTTTVVLLLCCGVRG